MSPKDWIEQNRTVEAAKAEILAALAATNGKLDIGVTAKAVKSIQRLDISNNYTSSKSFEFTISPVNPEKTILYFTGRSEWGSNSAYAGEPKIVLITETKVTLTGYGSGSGGFPAFKGSMYVIEFY